MGKRTMKIFGVTWAILGVTALILKAILRLAPISLESLGMEFNSLQWITLIGFSLFMLICEGYKGFQKSFSPRTAARIKYLRDQPNFLRTVLAPFFAIGFFQADRRTLIVSWALTGMIVILIILVGLLPQPWRGIIDLGVVLGLSWGLLSFWIFTAKALIQKEYSHSPCLDKNS